MVQPGRRSVAVTLGFLTLAPLLSAACRPDQTGAAVAEAKASETGSGDERARRLRDEALASARVWQPPAVPVGEADLRGNGAGTFDADQEVSCRFKLREVGGTSPKFYCELPNAGEVKVKYGANPELHAEVAASRLLTALGFGADRMSVVRRVRCAGCPRFPFQSLRCFERVGLQSACFPGGTNSDEIVDFDLAVIEQKLEGRVIEAFEDQGWAWFELSRIDPARGGSSRAELDALRLMAVFIAHWDNKATNQRLVCRPGGDSAGGGCIQPLAIMQDLGATFGPSKIDLHNWRQGQIWKDGAACMVSMEHLPWGGGTFPETAISEAGRQLLLGLLEQLSDQQLIDLFDGSRVTWHDQFSAEARHADAWVRVFKQKVKQIKDGGPCPS
jgi:hypothetical protein